MENLKVGQSFEVAKVLPNSLSHVGKSVVKIKDAAFPAYLVSEGNSFYGYYGSNSVVLLGDYEVKPIGKLTITKLK